jgi:Na+/proline symporter
MTTVGLGWFAVTLYFLVTIALAIRGARRTRSLATYAIGDRNIPAWVIGLSLAAQLTSVATFVVNPGLVYAFGLPALLGYGVSAGLGIMIGLAVLSRRFRAQGVRVQALTVPQWIGARYESTALRALFAVLSLALLTFATLIVVALSVVLARLLNLPADWVAVGLTAIVVTGVILGGATGHAWTNAVQAAIMLAVAVLLIARGVPLLSGEVGIGARLAAMDPNFLRAVNPATPYFRNVFEVFFCNFIVGIAIVCQPHVMSKALYVRDDREVRRYLVTAIAVGTVFTAVLVTGIWARLSLAQGVPIDRAIPTWIATTFPGPLQVLISVGLLCAGLSTLEGIFLALSATFSADFYPLFARERSERRALLTGRVGLAAAAAVTAALAIWQLEHPTGGTVAIFAQYGVYLLFSASFLPLACGMFLPRAGRGLVATGAIVTLASYVAVAVFRISPLHNNPAFLATVGILLGWAVVGAGLLVPDVRRRARIAVEEVR